MVQPTVIVIGVLLILVIIAIVFRQEHFGQSCTPECCTRNEFPGLSCDRGCICLTKHQKEMLNTHGYNSQSLETNLTQF